MKFDRFPSFALVSLVIVAGACNQDTVPTLPKTTSNSVKSNPCSVSGTLQLAVAQTTRIDCSNGGTTLTLAGNGASYLIVPEFPTDAVSNNLVAYRMITTDLLAASMSANRLGIAQRLAAAAGAGTSGGLLPRMRPRRAQLAAERFLSARARARASASPGGLRSLAFRQSAATRSAAVQVPAAGSIRQFHVASSFTANVWKTVGAKLSFVGSNILLYVDTLAPANGFTADQLTAFGQLFDQTLYPIDTTAFGSPSDIDQNGRAIVLMSPVVNADTPTAQCQTEGFVAGFFDPGDFDGPTDPNSNQGEVFYTIVPDPTGLVSCSHSVADLGVDVPATFLHELQHLINYSQHVVVDGGDPGASWLDEGLSIVAEELGSLYYEQKCPPPACRSNPSQIFPDSSQGFAGSMLDDSYQFALLPDTASITLNDDSQGGFSWRGGAWLLTRWLGDQMGPSFFRKLEHGSSSGVTSIEQASGQSFPSLFANFGLALYTDSLPGLARTTAPAVNRFTSRNVKQLWARIFATSGPSTDFPLANPLQLFQITSDTTLAVLSPGTTTYFRLDTPASSATVSIQFSGAGGVPFASTLKPQLAIFRLPAGQ